MYVTSLLSTPGQFEPVLLPYISKNDDEELCFLNNLALGTVSFYSTLDI